MLWLQSEENNKMVSTEQSGSLTNGMINYVHTFGPLVRKFANSALSLIPDMSRETLEAELWATVATAFSTWDAEKAPLEAWVRIMLRGKIRDLRKSLQARRKAWQHMTYLADVPGDENGWLH